MTTGSRATATATATAAGPRPQPAVWSIGADLGPVVDALAANAAEHDRDATFPFEAFDLLWSSGLLNLTLPIHLGGTGAGLVEACRVLEEVGRGDPSVALVHSQHLMFHALLADPQNVWPASVRDRVQTSSRDGVALINALRVEPELGTPARGGLPATVAERQADGGWILRGRKIYSTGIPGLRWLAVYARTDDAEPHVGTFLVEAGTPGYRVEQTWDHLGMRATRSDDVIFESCAIPGDHAVDIAPVDKAGPPDPRLMVWNNLAITALYQGVARAARDWLVGYLHERVPSGLGAPLASLPRFQEAVGRIEARLHASGRLLHGAAADAEHAADAATAAASAALTKFTVTSNAIDIVSEAIALVGNPGLSRRHPLERHLRNVLCSRIHTPQDDTILGAAGRSALAAGAPPAPPPFRDAGG